MSLVAAASMATALVALPASAAVTPGDVRVSGPSPYAGCSTPPGSSGAVFPQAEVEPQAASNPANASNLIGVWQQDRWSNGGSHGLVAGSSFDGGKSWRETTLPFNRCAPGGLSYERASDPWVSIGPDGTAYAVSLSVSHPNSGPTAVAAASSHDGGRTWGNLRVIQADTNGNIFFNDKESVTADPIHAGTAYVVWDRSRTAPRGHFRVPTMFSKTTDGGHTWSTPRAIAATGLDQQSIGNVVVADPKTGVLYDFYGFFFCICVTVPRIEFVKSTDGGATWSRPHTVNTLDAIGIVDPNTGELLRTEDFTPTVALSPSDGSLHAAWQTPRFNGGHFDEVAISNSTDGGRTWSPARRANSNTGRPAFTPTLAINASGMIGLTYYDLRSLAPNQVTTLPTDYWLRTSSDGGRTLSADQHVAGPFNMKAAPVSTGRGFFIGDYQGLTSFGNQFVPFFVQTNCLTITCPVNPTDVYAAQVTPLPAAADNAGAGALAPLKVGTTGSSHRPSPTV